MGQPSTSVTCSASHQNKSYSCLIPLELERDLFPLSVEHYYLVHDWKLKEFWQRRMCARTWEVMRSHIELLNCSTVMYALPFHLWWPYICAELTGIPAAQFLDSVGYWMVHILWDLRSRPWRSLGKLLLVRFIGCTCATTCLNVRSGSLQVRFRCGSVVTLRNCRSLDLFTFAFLSLL